MQYSAIAAVRNRLGNPRAVLVPDSVNVGDVVKFLDGVNNNLTQHETLGLVHEILPIDESGATERFATILGGKLYEATAVWHPEPCRE